MPMDRRVLFTILGYIFGSIDALFALIALAQLIRIYSISYHVHMKMTAKKVFHAVILVVMLGTDTHLRERE